MVESQRKIANLKTNFLANNHWGSRGRYAVELEIIMNPMFWLCSRSLEVPKKIRFQLVPQKTSRYVNPFLPSTSKKNRGKGTPKKGTEVVLGGYSPSLWPPLFWTTLELGARRTIYKQWGGWSPKWYHDSPTVKDALLFATWAKAWDPAHMSSVTVCLSHR